MVEELEQLTQQKIKQEKLIYKDQVMRTFIAHDSLRPIMTAHAYDITRGIVTPQDTIVIVDDYLRGTTIKIIAEQLSSLQRKKYYNCERCALSFIP